MKIEYDPAKRAKTLRERGLDFEDAREVFAGEQFTFEDARFDYGEQRFFTVGEVNGQLVGMVWTPRGCACRIISMRRIRENEIEKIKRRVRMGR